MSLIGSEIVGFDATDGNVTLYLNDGRELTIGSSVGVWFAFKEYNLQ